MASTNHISLPCALCICALLSPLMTPPPPSAPSLPHLSNPTMAPHLLNHPLTLQVHAHGGQLLHDGFTDTFYWVGTSQKVSPHWTSWAINLYSRWGRRSLLLAWAFARNVQPTCASIAQLRMGISVRPLQACAVPYINRAPLARCALQPRPPAVDAGLRHLLMAAGGRASKSLCENALGQQPEAPGQRNSNM